jgi:hypothetical protein
MSGPGNSGVMEYWVKASLKLKVPKLVTTILYKKDARTGCVLKYGGITISWIDEGIFCAEGW